jgi:hypothetical protein
MSEELHGRKANREAGRIMVGVGLAVLGALSLMVLNTVLKTADAVADIKVAVGITQERTINQNLRIDRLENLLYPRVRP